MVAVADHVVDLAAYRPYASLSGLHLVQDEARQRAVAESFMNDFGGVDLREKRQIGMYRRDEGDAVPPSEAAPGLAEGKDIGRVDHVVLRQRFGKPGVVGGEVGMPRPLRQEAEPACAQARRQGHVADVAAKRDDLFAVAEEVDGEIDAFRQVYAGLGKPLPALDVPARVFRQLEVDQDAH